MPYWPESSQICISSDRGKSVSGELRKNSKCDTQADNGYLGLVKAISRVEKEHCIGRGLKDAGGKGKTQNKVAE